LLGALVVWKIIAMKGVVSRVRRDQEGAASVLRFVITAEDGRPAAVEMRGQEIRGVLDDGDLVVLRPESQGPPADGVHRPRAVENRTTGSAVTAWRPSLPQRAAKPLLAALVSAAISSGVTFCFGLLLTSEEAASPTAGVDGSEGTDWFPFALPGSIAGIMATSAFLWFVWFALFGWRRQRRGRRIWPVAPGLVLGVAIGFWAVGVSQGSTIG
jgi:hypothetical protein